MDLKTRDVPPTDHERQAVDSVLGPATEVWQGVDRSERGVREAGAVTS